ncbi:MAG: formate dehydrogenase accessory sulfurtransferase FdhD [Bacteroidetes bacterium]|jgi:FdhD protein|nr:formate dehydrogenase accessory sulfurtransferase FdhD [Bacteroidota bacterium]MDF1863831.1 formate dehydrogenase accessory sulfurtransferase FdhD [Saprospiraceae bacterium]
MRSILKVEIQKISKKSYLEIQDSLVIEEPLEIRIGYGSLQKRLQKSISVTMRTPGNDFELATGFLFTEGIIKHKKDILKTEYVPTFHQDSKENIVKIELAPSVEFEMANLERNFYTTSSCGVCGKASIEAVHSNEIPDLNTGYPIFEVSEILKFPDSLIQRQNLFEHTGGLHAAALFNSKGELTLIKEDIGRHNAVDKLIGSALLKNKVPLSDYLILVSGRAGFELVQKSIVAGIPILAAVGAPSSLSTKLADESGMTLIGFLKNEKFNIYTHSERINLNT